MATWRWGTLDERLDGATLIRLLNERMKMLENTLAMVQGRVVTFSAGDTTPSVSGVAVAKTNNGAATTVTKFEGGRSGQSFLLRFGDASTTLAHGSNLKLVGAVNYTGAVGDTKEFFTTDGVTFEEQPIGATWS